MKRFLVFVVVVLFTLSFIALLFLFGTGVHAQVNKSPVHVYVIGNGNVVNEVIEEDKTLAATFELVGRKLASQKWYVVSTDLNIVDGNCDNVESGDPLDNTVVKTDAGGRFSRPVTITNCDQNNYPIRVKGPYLCVGCVNNSTRGILMSSQATHTYTTIVDVDAPQP